MGKRLGRDVKQSLKKAREAALLAIETYNKPAVSFRSGGYIVLMVIAWNSLFHAIFFERKKKPFYKDGYFYKKRDGEFIFWELSKCVKKYFESDTQNPVRVNLSLFIPLRNMIEHKHMPEIDASLFGECQAMLINFDKMLEKEFGIEYCLRESLSFAVQLFPSSQSLNAAVQSNPANKPIVDFIKNYRSSISTEVHRSGEYSFKAFLIQVGNHDSKDALPVHFTRWDRLSDEEKRNVDRVAALIKNKVVHVPVANADLIKPGKVVRLVQQGLGNPKVTKNGQRKDKYNQHTHTLCWKKYEVRPNSNSTNPENTKPEYCVYDQPNNCYLYTQAWVDFLVDEMKNEEKYTGLWE